MGDKHYVWPGDWCLKWGGGVGRWGWLLTQLKIKIIWESVLCNALFMWLITIGSFTKNKWSQETRLKEQFSRQVSKAPLKLFLILAPASFVLSPQFEPNCHSAASHAQYKGGPFSYSFTCPRVSLWFSWQFTMTHFLMYFLSSPRGCKQQKARDYQFCSHR